MYRLFFPSNYLQRIQLRTKTGVSSLATAILSSCLDVISPISSSLFVSSASLDPRILAFLLISGSSASFPPTDYVQYMNKSVYFPCAVFSTLKQPELQSSRSKRNENCERDQWNEISPTMVTSLSRTSWSPVSIPGEQESACLENQTGNK